MRGSGCWSEPRIYGVCLNSLMVSGDIALNHLIATGGSTRIGESRQSLLCVVETQHPLALRTAGARFRDYPYLLVANMTRTAY